MADERERQSGITDELLRLGAIVDFKQIDVGDYLVAPDCAVERKSIRDLMRSIYDGRLFAQCSEIITHYSRPMLIIEGDIEYVHMLSENPMIFYGTLASLTLDFKLAIMHTKSKAQTAMVLFALARRTSKEQRKGPLIKKIRKGDSSYMQQLSILASLPGVGEKLAARILKKFGTPIRALNASSAELSRVQGMGYARASKLRKILDTMLTSEEVRPQMALDGYDTSYE